MHKAKGAELHARILYAAFAMLCSRGACTGGLQLVLYEKSCVLPSLCGLTGEKIAMGINFTFTNTCCDTDLCNSAPVWRQKSKLPIHNSDVINLLSPRAAK
ncbi:UNVERIFIED_CONTAM: hypothetical protein FKN15_053223 [Acipenser sinensis]